MGTRKTKTPVPTSPLDAVAELLAERAKFEQWMDDLEAKKDTTPSKVFDRVRHDYLGRLQGVMDQLKQHTVTLQEHAASLGKKLVELSSAEESRVEERSEAELRAKVGEMTPAEWESVSRKADRELAKLKEDKEEVEGELQRVKDVLAELEGGPPKEKEKDASKVDELAFLKSVVGTGPRPAATPPQSAAAQPPAAPRASGGSAPAATPTSTAAQTPGSAPAAPPPPPPAPTPTPAAATPVTPDQPKTLKCQECGSMNYPSEWYCERCGAELTVV